MEHCAMPQLAGVPLGLDDAERAALIAVLKEAIVTDRFPLSPRVRMLLPILEKLEPPPVQAGPGESKRSKTR
jgi:hypothetical protein